jgi:hypothetical protein
MTNRAAFSPRPFLSGSPSPLPSSFPHPSPDCWKKDQSARRSRRASAQRYAAQRRSACIAARVSLLPSISFFRLGGRLGEG